VNAEACKEELKTLAPACIQHLDWATLGQALCILGTIGFVKGTAHAVGMLLVTTGVADEDTGKGGGKSVTCLTATNNLFALGPSRSIASASRRVMAFLREYREHLLDDLCMGLKRLPDDRALASLMRMATSMPAYNPLSLACC